MYHKFVDGKRHDAAMLVDSGLLQDSEKYSHVGGRPMCVYGDPAYPHRVHFQAPFRNRLPTAKMLDFYRSMSSVRVSVEWLFGDIGNCFRFLDYKNKI